MKNINKTDLHINNIVNVLKYIVFIMAFVFTSFSMKGIISKAALYSGSGSVSEDSIVVTSHIENTWLFSYVGGGSFCVGPADSSVENCIKDSENFHPTNMSKTAVFGIKIEVKATVSSFYRRLYIYYKSSAKGAWTDIETMYPNSDAYRNMYLIAPNNPEAAYIKSYVMKEEEYMSRYDEYGMRVWAYGLDAKGNPVNAHCADIPAYYFTPKRLELTPDSYSFAKNHSVYAKIKAYNFSPYKVFYKWSSESTNANNTYTHCIVDDRIFLSECTKAGFSSSFEADYDLNSFNITKSSGNGDYYLHVLAKNTEGTSVTKTVGPIKFDNTAPSFASSLDSSTWKKENTIWVEYTDVGGSGVSHLMYCTSLDCTPSTKVNLSKDGKFYISVGNLEGKVPITFFAVDNAGNVTSNKTIQYKFDYTAPTLKSRTNSPPYNGWYKGGNTIDFVFSDKGTASNQSNISKIEMCIKVSSGTCTPRDIGGFTPTSEKTVSVKFSDYISRTDTYSFSFIVTDVAGNIYTNTSVGTYKVDLTKPTLASNGKVVTNDGIRQSHEATFTFTDTGSGIYKIYYCWIKSSVGTCTPNKEVANGGKITEKSLDGKYILNVQARDRTENWSNVIYVEFEFDNTAPDFSIEYVTEDEENFIEVISEVSFMEYEDLEEEIEVVDEVSEEIEIIEIKEEIKIEENEVEIASVKPLVIEMVHVPVTTDSVHYILSGLRSSIVIGGTCLFLKERKRVNVS